MDHSPTKFVARLGRRGDAGRMWIVVGPVLALLAGALAGRLGRWLLGRLRRGARIGAPWCELAVGVAWAAAVTRWCAGGQPAWWLPVPLAVAWFGALLTATDLRHRRLPDALTLAAYPVLGGLLAVASAAGAGGALLLRGVVGVLLFGGAHAVTHLLRPAALGAGDVKLAGSLGAVLGAVSLPALALGAVLAALVTAILGALARRVRRPGLPHGPGLVIAAWTVSVAAGTAALVPP
jgi:leader peptidase (prepilin peptidase)/N-methyltransferase